MADQDGRCLKNDDVISTLYDAVNSFRGRQMKIFRPTV